MRGRERAKATWPNRQKYRNGTQGMNIYSKLSISSSISVKGDLVETPDGKQPFEIHAKEIEILGASDLDYPIQNKRHTFEYLRTVAHLRPRTNTFMAVFRVR